MQFFLFVFKLKGIGETTKCFNVSFKQIKCDKEEKIMKNFLLIYLFQIDIESNICIQLKIIPKKAYILLLTSFRFIKNVLFMYFYEKKKNGLRTH